MLRTTKAKTLAGGIIAEFATRADACAGADGTREPGRWKKAWRLAVDPTQSQVSLTDDGRRKSVPSAGKVGPPGDSSWAAAAVPAAADDVRGRADADACASAAADADVDARRTGRRRARTATDAAASSVPWDC